jgi:outer membrane receptor for ferrienterochelin and colicins
MAMGGSALVLALAQAASPAPSAAAPETGASLAVAVRDAWGVIPGASVRLTHHDTRATAQQSTDGAGTASFSVPPGLYALGVSFSGFADHVEPVTLSSGEQSTLTVTLALPQFSTTLTVTTASRREELLRDVASPTTVIDAVQIEDTGARSAKDVLVEQSGNGIQVHAGGGQGHVSINGIPDSGVLVLVDGRRYLGKDANGNFNLEDLLVGNVERIEVVKGATSALYGADALGGVVNFITRKSRVPGVTNRLELTAGSHKDLYAADDFAWRAARGGLALSGGYRTYDGFDLDAQNPQTIGQPESQWYYGSTSADLNLTPRLVARFVGDYQRRDVDRYFFSGPTQLASTVYDSQRALTRLTASPELELLASPRTSVSAVFTYGEYRRDETRLFLQGGAAQPQAAWREWSRELKLTGRHDWSALGRKHPLQGGYEHRQERLRRGTLSRADPRRDIDTLWLQQEWAASQKWKLTGGFRHDRYSDFGGEWSPKLAAVFAPAGDHRVRASYGHGFRAPYFGELFLTTPPLFVGNPDLEPEVSDTVTAGYAYASRRAQASADYSWTRVRNGIVFDLTHQPFTYGNIAEYTARAVNLAFSATLPAGFASSVAYTWLRRENEAGQDLGAYPNHSFFVKLQWSHARWGLRANVRGQVNGGQSESLTDLSFVPAYDAWYAQVRKRLLARGAYSWSAFAQVDNLFDERNVFRRGCVERISPTVCARHQPVPNDFQVWLAPRAFLAGVTLDMDFSR